MAMTLGPEGNSKKTILRIWKSVCYKEIVTDGWNIWLSL